MLRELNVLFSVISFSENHIGLQVKYVVPKDWNSEIPRRVQEGLRFNYFSSVKEDDLEYIKYKAELETQQYQRNLYAEVKERKIDITTKISEIYTDLRNKEYDKREKERKQLLLVTEWEKCLRLSNGDREIASNFFLNTYTQEEFEAVTKSKS